MSRFLVFLVSFALRVYCSNLEQMKLSEVMVAWQRQKSKCRAPPMKSSEVVANTTWESLQAAGADCCVPLGIKSSFTFKCCVVWL